MGDEIESNDRETFFVLGEILFKHDLMTLTVAKPDLALELIDALMMAPGTRKDSTVDVVRGRVTRAEEKEKEGKESKEKDKEGLYHSIRSVSQELLRWNFGWITPSFKKQPPLRTI